MNSRATTTITEEFPSIAPAAEPKESAQVLPLDRAQALKLTPRDINTHLARTLERYDALTADFARNKLAIDAELAALKQVGGETSRQIVQMHAALLDQNTALESHNAQSQRAIDSLTLDLQSNLAQSEARGQALVQTLGNRVDADIQRLHQGVCAIDDMLAMQTCIVREQTARLDQFDAAYELLDTATRGNRNRIEAVRAEAQRQHTIALAQLAGLEALQQGQSAQLAELRQTLVLLQTESDRLHGAIQTVSQDLQTHAAKTQHTFTQTHRALAGLLLLVLSGLALVKWVPAFAPASSDAGLVRANEHLQAIDTQVATLPTMQAAAATQDSRITALADTVKSLERRVGVVQTSVRALRALVPDSARPVVPAPPVADRQWLLQQPAASLTVQLAGLPSEETLQTYLTQHAAALAGKSLAVTVTHPAQGLRYNLFYGVFDTQEQARQALDALPPELRSSQPWVRAIAAVQSTLK